MRAWPDLTEYHEAVQHPPKAFADPGLKAVTLELDRFGMPKPGTGGNAVVYKANEPGGLLTFKMTWAIRCFLRPISDHAERYEAISKHLRKVRLPYDVNFQFLKQGIQIRSTWFPIVKMQWAKGDLLHSHIEKHLGYPAALAALRAKWAILVRHLEAAQVAHGDLATLTSYRIAGNRSTGRCPGGHGARASDEGQQARYRSQKSDELPVPYLDSGPASRFQAAADAASAELDEKAGLS